MKWLREPLVHFLALGALIFALFALFGAPERGQTDRILVTGAQIDFLVQAFGKTWQRPPTEQELRGLVDDFVREEIYYREALAMGLDREDTIVRRRMRQKLEFLTDDVSALGEPAEEELESYLAANPETFRVPTQLSFDQIFFSFDDRDESAADDAAAMLSRLQEGELESADPAELGDSIMLPAFVGMASEPAIDRRFGSGFARQLESFPIGAWEGPVRSGFGLHLVRVRDRRASEEPTLDDVRDAVEREWRAARRAEAADAFYDGLRQRYTVEIEWPDEVGP